MVPQKLGLQAAGNARPEETQIPEIPALRRLVSGTSAYRKLTFAISVGGFSNFAMLYGLQPLMPNLSASFGLSAAGASGVISLATAAMALCLIPASLLAERYGKRQMMMFSVFGSALFSLLCCIATDFHQLLVLRVLVGICLAALPAAAISYLSETIHPDHVGRAVGLYIAGNALGGMAGRFAGAIVADFFNWRIALALLGISALIAAWLFSRGLPEQSQGVRRTASLRKLRVAARQIFADAGLPWIFLTGFILMGCFVSIFNYLAYRLGTQPFGFSQSQSSIIYALNAAGIFASAWAGAMADRFGRRNVLWILVGLMLLGVVCTLPDNLLAIYAGTALLSFGFFGGHSVASSWLGFRAGQHRALASALYLTVYYLGSSLVGSFSGVMWGGWGWDGIVCALAVLLSAALLVALKLRTLVPRK